MTGLDRHRLEPPPPGEVITDPVELLRRRDAFFEQTVERIEDGQHTVQAVFGNAPIEGFAYTVGLHSNLGCPELWVGTLSPEQSANLLNGMVTLIREHGWEAVSAGGLIGFDLEPDVREWFDQFQLAGPVSLEAAQPNLALAVAGRVSVDPPSAVEVWQVFWPDDKGRFPEDGDYDQETWPQRVLPLAASLEGT